MSGGVASASPAAGGTIKHWGAFIGGLRPPFPYDLHRSPVPLSLPGRIAEIATSNSSQYALLANGSVYAWGLGKYGQLGDGSTENSFTRPVRVRFPAGVKIASIPVDVMPFDTALAVDTTGHVRRDDQRAPAPLRSLGLLAQQPTTRDFLDRGFWPAL